MKRPMTMHDRVQCFGALGLMMAAGTALGAPPATYCIRDLGTLDGPSQAFALAAGAPVGISINPASNFVAARFAGLFPESFGPVSSFSQSVALAGTGDGAALIGSYSPGTPGYSGASASASPVVITALGEVLPRGANSAGVIVGVANVMTTDLLSFDRAIRRSASGAVTVLPMLSGGFASSASAINSGGWVVGWSYPSANTKPHAVLWVANAKPVDLGMLGAKSGDPGMSQASAINDAGVIVGCSTTKAGPIHACKWVMKSASKVRTRTDLGALASGSSSFALGINTVGDIVGQSAGRAFISSGGAMIDLNSRLAPDIGWTLATATAIDDAGRIVGSGVHDGHPAAFVLSVTCPADVAGLLSGGPDGQVTVDDALAFLEAFSREPAVVAGRAGLADIAGLDGELGADGVLSAEDVMVFLEAFAEGCP